MLYIVAALSRQYFSGPQPPNQSYTTPLVNLLNYFKPQFNNKYSDHISIETKYIIFQLDGRLLKNIYAFFQNDSITCLYSRAPIHLLVINSVV